MTTKTNKTEIDLGIERTEIDYCEIPGLADIVYSIEEEYNDEHDCLDVVQTNVYANNTKQEYIVETIIVYITGEQTTWDRNVSFNDKRLGKKSETMEHKHSENTLKITIKFNKMEAIAVYSETKNSEDTDMLTFKTIKTKEGLHLHYDIGLEQIGICLDKPYLIPQYIHKDTKEIIPKANCEILH